MTTATTPPPDAPPTTPDVRQVRSWPILLLALPAFVAIWSGWVGLGELTGAGTGNAARVARLKARNQELTQDEAAARLGISVRTVRRYWPTTTAPTTTTDPDGPAPIPTLPTPTTTDTETGDDASRAA